MVHNKCTREIIIEWLEKEREIFNSKTFTYGKLVYSLKLALALTWVVVWVWWYVRVHFYNVLPFKHEMTMTRSSKELFIHLFHTLCIHNFSVVLVAVVFSANFFHVSMAFTHTHKHATKPQRALNIVNGSSYVCLCQFPCSCHTSTCLIAETPHKTTSTPPFNSVKTAKFTETTKF